MGNVTRGQGPRLERHARGLSTSDCGLRIEQTTDTARSFRLRSGQAFAALRMTARTRKYHAFAPKGSNDNRDPKGVQRRTGTSESMAPGKTGPAPGGQAVAHSGEKHGRAPPGSKGEQGQDRPWHTGAATVGNVTRRFRGGLEWRGAKRAWPRRRASRRPGDSLRSSPGFDGEWLRNRGRTVFRGPFG